MNSIGVEGRLWFAGKRSRRTMPAPIIRMKATGDSSKQKGLWTKPRHLLDLWLSLAASVVMMLVENGWYTAVLVAVIAAGGLIALAFRMTRRERPISIR